MEAELMEHPRRWPALGVLSLTLVAVTLDNSVLNTALPSLARGLSATTADLQWITDAYTLVFAAALILAGSLGARLGARRALIGGLVVFAGGSAAAALSTSPAQLIGWRALMGLGAAFVMPATLAIITRMFSAAERPKAFAIWSAAAGVGILIGPATGGLLLEHFSWSSTFWINIPLVVAAVIATALAVPAIAPQRTGKLDLLGALLSTAAVAALVDAIIEAPERGWTATTTVAEFALAGLLTAAFVGWELRVAEPLVQLRLFANRRFGLAALALAVTFFALFGTLFELSQFLQLVHGYSPLVAGLGAMPFAVAMATTSATSAITSRWLGITGALVVGLLCVAAGLGALATIEPDTAFAIIAAETALVGAGMGLLMAPASLEITAAVPVRYAAMASSLNSVIRELGGVLGIAVVGTVVSAFYRSTMSATPGVAGHDLPSAHAVAAQLPPEVAGPMLDAADRAFTDAMNRGALVASTTALVAALLVLTAMPRRGAQPASEVPQPRRDLQPA
ncbi:EmrB/QacA subfamily drug resistance transporter [Allocatelliglobosispora scoriae]|uniref:EmrB/QacA subfamily drug resistance transporter n=1 Tax=Allocatelliglobosispora scoriae TaxID=643052 RepID=A0A841BGU7_9ACTN|nr:MFS transporter [Allocatelliglobosispora scoriae]MBB5868307.1 EmrB/QacA subfamily drug resistance transporter [Allocatelliglobosispora scoriae]